MSVWRRLLPPLLMLSVMVSALAVVWSKQRYRSLQTERQNLTSAQDRAATEFNQLRLERATFASHARIEHEAVSQLQMQDPDDYAIVLVPAAAR